MKLYFYELLDDGEINSWSKEFEEKAKTYINAGGMYKTRIRKDEIGKVGKYFDRLILLEDDIEKAKRIFAEHKKKKLMGILFEIQTKLDEMDEIEKVVDILEGKGDEYKDD